MKKYIVYITHYTGNKLPEWYIGSSYEEKINNGYNGSVASKKYKEIYNKEQKENKHLFKTKILSYHETSEEALEEELRLQKKHSVVKNNRYFNECYAQLGGYCGRDTSGKLNPNYGNKWNEEQRERQSNNTINTVNVRHKITGECYRVSREEWKNNPDLEAESKGRKIKDTSNFGSTGELNGMFGKNHSEKTKEKMRKPKGPQVRLICSHCGKEGGASNMKRYHLENCKLKGK